MKAKREMYTVLALLLVLVVTWGQAIYITAKAHVAQYFLERTWQQRDEQANDLKPWQSLDANVVGALTMMNETTIVLNELSGQSMAFAPALMAGDAVALDQTEYVIAAHRDSHFARLSEVSKGDLVRWQTVEGLDQWYQVEAIEIVDSSIEQFEYFNEPGKLTLITCYPFDALSTESDLRYVVEAKQWLSTEMSMVYNF